VHIIQVLLPEYRFAIFVIQGVNFFVALTIADIVEALVCRKCSSAWNSVSAFILRFDLPDIVVDSRVP
jgi:hypothetical protein